MMSLIIEAKQKNETLNYSFLDAVKNDFKNFIDFDLAVSRPKGTS